jgi:hypothetical protein
VNTIYKYQLEVKTNQTVKMHEGAQILSVQVQRGVPCVWAVVDPDQPEASYGFETYGAGHPVPPDTEHVVRDFVGTYQLNDGEFVGHVFVRVYR